LYSYQRNRPFLANTVSRQALFESPWYTIPFATPIPLSASLRQGHRFVENLIFYRTDRKNRLYSYQRNRPFLANTVSGQESEGEKVFLINRTH
jgi:hypothetical protein